MKKKRTMGKMLLYLEIIILLASFWGCGTKEKSVKKVRNIEFTIIDQSEIPRELSGVMEEKKQEGFKLTYADKENLYLAVGYGKQNTGGYSISVDECFLAENAIYLGTTLTGPQKGEKVNEVPSYPCIVLKAEYIDEPVVFE